MLNDYQLHSLRRLASCCSFTSMCRMKRKEGQRKQKLKRKKKMKSRKGTRYWFQKYINAATKVVRLIVLKNNLLQYCCSYLDTTWQRRWSLCLVLVYRKRRLGHLGRMVQVFCSLRHGLQGAGSNLHRPCTDAGRGSVHRTGHGCDPLLFGALSRWQQSILEILLWLRTLDLLCHDVWISTYHLYRLYP